MVMSFTSRLACVNTYSPCHNSGVFVSFFSWDISDSKVNMIELSACTATNKIWYLLSISAFHFTEWDVDEPIWSSWIPVPIFPSGECSAQTFNSNKPLCFYSFDSNFSMIPSFHSYSLIGACPFFCLDLNDWASEYKYIVNSVPIKIIHLY